MASIGEFPELSSLADEDILLIEATREDAAGAKNKGYYQVSLGDLKLFLGTSSPPSKSVDLNFVSNGDTNGVFFYLGSNRGLEAFSNPMIRGEIFINQSTFFSPGTYKPEFLCDRAGGVSHTDTQSSAWFSIDLGINKTLKPNYYSLRGRTDQYNSNHPRSWRFEASNDGANWAILNTQTNNTTLVQNAWLSIPLVNVGTAYRYFRLIQTGNDSSGAQYFVLGEMEIYGTFSTS